MREAEEYNLYIDIGEKSFSKMIDVFYVGRTVQLPVVKDRKIVGIIDLFELLKNRSASVSELMDTDFEVAGDAKGVFLFKNSKQYILPIVDENGDFTGFVNKLLSKVYLPSKEYMRVVEEKLGDIKNENGDVDIDKVRSKFDALIEKNYDGMYVTVDKGVSIGMHEGGTYFSGITRDDLTIENADVKISTDGDSTESFEVNTTEVLQARNEKSVSDDLIPDGGIVKIVNNLKDFEEVKKELYDIKKVAEKYEDELEFLRWEQTKTDDVIAESDVMKRIINMAVKVAKVDSTVLIQGQSGVGKGVLSQIIHNNSNRKDGPFIKIDCSLIPENLLESELFGYEAGSFTGASKTGKTGLVELANNGALFTAGTVISNIT